jgi:hypothetical protein
LESSILHNGDLENFHIMVCWKDHVMPT